MFMIQTSMCAIILLQSTTQVVDVNAMNLKILVWPAAYTKLCKKPRCPAVLTRYYCRNAYTTVDATETAFNVTNCRGNDLPCAS